MKKLILAYLILGLNFLHAQNLDSLSNEIQKKATLANVREFVIATYNIIPTNPEKGFSNSILAQKYAYQINNDSLIILSQRAIGRTYDFLSKNDSALFHYLKAVDFCLKYNDSLQMGFAYNSVANIYITMLNYDKAQQFALKSIKVFEKIKRNDLLIFPIVNSGNIYYYLKDVKKAVKYWENAIEIINRTNTNKFYLGMLYGNLGSAYSEFNQIQKSIDYHELALETAKQNEDIYSQIQALHNIGLNLIELKKYKQANSYIRNSLRLSESIQDSAGIVSRFILLGNLKYYQNQQDSAIYYYEKGKQIAERIDFYFAMKSIYIGLQKTYEANGDYKKSINYFREYVNVLDSIYNSEKHESINRLNIQYETEKKDLEIDKKNAEIELKKVESKRKNLVIYSVVLVLCIVIVFSVLLYNRFKLIKRQKAIIEVQKHEVEEKNREITESITYAKRLQDATLPPLKLVKEYLKDSFILYLPKDIVAGDFYWMENVNGEIYFAAADCTGHGVPGAMVSVVCSNALKRAVNEFGLLETNLILDKVRELVIENFEKSDTEVKDGMDISLCKFNPENKSLQWSGANNPLWVLKNNIDSTIPNELIEYKPNKQPIGKFDDAVPFSAHTIQLQENDCVYIFTDGYADQFGGEKGKKFMYKSLKELCISISDLDMETQKNIIQIRFNEWKGTLSQVDDICIIGLKV